MAFSRLRTTPSARTARRGEPRGLRPHAARLRSAGAVRRPCVACAVRPLCVARCVAERVAWPVASQALPHHGCSVRRRMRRDMPRHGRLHALQLRLQQRGRRDAVHGLPICGERIARGLRNVHPPASAVAAGGTAAIAATAGGAGAIAATGTTDVHVWHRLGSRQGLLPKHVRRVRWPWVRYVSGRPVQLLPRRHRQQWRCVRVGGADELRDAAERERAYRIERDGHASRVWRLERDADGMRAGWHVDGAERHPKGGHGRELVEHERRRYGRVLLRNAADCASEDGAVRAEHLAVWRAVGQGARSRLRAGCRSRRGSERAPVW